MLVSSIDQQYPDDVLLDHLGVVRISQRPILGRYNEIIGFSQIEIMLLESAQLCLLVLGFTEILVWGKIFQFELHPSSTTPYARKLISANRTGFEKLKNGVYSAVPDMDDPAHANNRGLSEFHALRHLSRYEQAFRTRHDIDHQRHWDGVYDFDIQNETQYLQSSRSLYYLGHQTDSYQSVPLSQGYGTHYANVSFGQPKGTLLFEKAHSVLFNSRFGLGHPCPSVKLSSWIPVVTTQLFLVKVVVIAENPTTPIPILTQRKARPSISFSAMNAEMASYVKMGNAYSHSRTPKGAAGKLSK